MPLRWTHTLIRIITRTRTIISGTMSAGIFFVFYALLAGTVITVLASFIPFGNYWVNIGVALAIACVKAFLVAGYFMHLISERRMVYGILVCTVFFFIGLMGLTIWAMSDFPWHTTHH